MAFNTVLGRPQVAGAELRVLEHFILMRDRPKVFLSMLHFERPSVRAPSFGLTIEHTSRIIFRVFNKY